MRKVWERWLPWASTLASKREADPETMCQPGLDAEIGPLDTSGPVPTALAAEAFPAARTPAAGERMEATTVLPPPAEPAALGEAPGPAAAEAMKERPPSQPADPSPPVPTAALPAPPHVGPGAGPSAASAELARIRSALAEIWNEASALVATGELPLIGWGLTKPRVQKLTELEHGPEHESSPWFFIGDIHGDFLAWHRLLTRVREQPGFRLCFLGDLVDRGPLSLECFALLLETAICHPGQVLWILGNHDEDLRYVGKRFVSGIDPAEFCDWLNDSSAADPAVLPSKAAWGSLFVQVTRRLPRAVLFSDGTLATHGGIPLEDRWPHLRNMESFHHERCLGDFTWTRAMDAPIRTGWRYATNRQASSDFQFGYKDLEQFCEAVRSIFPVARLIRGHDHVEHGHEAFGSYERVPILTLNGFGFNYITNSVAKYRPELVLGVGQPHALPRIERIPVDPAEHASLYAS